jgi:uncharacterized membrane protein/glutaredoxin
MAKTKNKKSRPDPRPPQVAITQNPNWILFALAVAGMLVTAYLTYSAWQNKLVAGCAVGGGCDIVLSSRWSMLFGMPIAFWGFLTYALLAAVAWNKRTDSQWKLAFFISSIGVLYSLYLTGISLFVLQASCPYCLTSLTLMTAIFLVALFQRPARLTNFSWGAWLGKSLGTGLVLILALHLHYAGVWGKTSGPEDPWVRGLANHLSETGAKFYGAFWCPHCRDQKELFGSSVHRLPYIECSPGGQGTPQASVCDAAGVKSYPTWIINGTRYVGTQSLDELARYSRYKPEGVNP